MCETPTTVVLDELDADRLLRVLYNGPRPAKVHTLICLCGAIADLRESPRAWNGWQILPTAKCPNCLAKPRKEACDGLESRSEVSPDSVRALAAGSVAVDQDLRWMNSERNAS